MKTQKTKTRLGGLYAVTPDLAHTPTLVELAEAALQGGAALLQYRNKTASAALRREQASALLALCREYGVPLIINDHVDLCHDLDADGVHLGGEDGAIAQARVLLGPGKIIGASCYNRIELARQARAQGADYVAFGSCFGSSTKPAAVHAPLTLFAQTKAEIGLPAVAIGGITAENAALAIAAGADAVAIINALFAVADVRLAAQTITNLFTQDHHEQKPATV